MVDQDHIGWQSWKLIAQTISLSEPNIIHLLQGEHGEILRRLEVGAWVGKSDVLEHTSGNILSETRKDRGNVTMEGL